MYSITDTVTLLELVYTLTGLIGLIYAVRWSLKARADRHGLKAEGINGGRAIAASINCAIGWAMCAKLAVYVLVGCLTMMLPVADGDDPPWQSTVSGVLFLFSQGIAVWLLIFLNNQYDQMVRYFEAHQQDAHHLRRPRNAT